MKFKKCQFKAKATEKEVILSIHKCALLILY